jgi:OOP family OmpA-OmpF porin/outer membrane immunogenic protein
MRKATILGVLALAGTLASPAFADEFSGWRLGMAAGQEELQGRVQYRGYFDDVDPNRVSYSFFGGWGLNKWLAVEVGYKDGGKFNADLESNGGFPTRRVVQHTAINGFEGSIVGSYWIGKKFSVFGRAGMFAWKGETTFSEDIDVATETPAPSRETFEDDGAEPFFGIGVQTQLDGALVRLEYQMVETSDFHVDDPNSTVNFVDMVDTKMTSLNLSVVWILH